MSAHIPPSKKFPYIVLGAGDNVEDVGSSQRKKHEVDGRSSNNHGVRLLPFGSPDHIPGLSGFIPAPISSRSSNPHCQNPNAASYNLSKMKAILTAQNELRQPASSLYPSASQLSLIPETEEIYRKYFPKDESSQNTARVSYRKGRDLGKQAGAYTLVSDGDDIKIIKGTATAAALSSSSESGIAPRQRPASSLPIPDELPISGQDAKTTEVMNTPPPTSPIDKQVTRQYIKDVELKFKKRFQSQFLSLSTEIERQSSELSDLRKELKDLKQSTRKSTLEQDGAKSRVDTLTKQVQDMDTKMDTLQESVTSQEKSFLSKLMLLGDATDSDSDDSSSSIKYFDPMRSSSCTKLAGLSSASGKRTSSASTIASPSRTIADAFPKVCSNWIPIAPDFDKLIHSVAILNYRMDRNQSMKVTTVNNGNGATFKHSDVIDLTLYKNGMTLGSSGFRSYSTMSVIKFVNEIFNSYLPTELSTQYPDGVVIVLTDKRSINSSNDTGFNGSGDKLVKQNGPAPPDLFPGRSINDLQKNKDNSAEFPPLSATVSQCSVSVSSSQNDCDILPELIVGTGESKQSAKTIRLKVNDAKTGVERKKKCKKYKLKVSINSTIKEVADHLKNAFEEREDIISSILTNGLEEAARSKTYDLILPVPYGKLACLEATLEEYGITQNTLLCVQEQRKFTRLV